MTQSRDTLGLLDAWGVCVFVCVWTAGLRGFIASNIPALTSTTAWGGGGLPQVRSTPLEQGSPSAFPLTPEVC